MIKTMRPAIYSACPAVLALLAMVLGQAIAASVYCMIELWPPEGPFETREILWWLQDEFQYNIFLGFYLLLVIPWGLKMNRSGRWWTKGFGLLLLTMVYWVAVGVLIFLRGGRL